MKRTNKKARKGWMTVAKSKDFEFAIYHDNVRDLKRAYEAITQNKFDIKYAQEVGVMKLPTNRNHELQPEPY